MDKAVKKGSIVIQRHSIKIDGKEYCKWIDDNYLMIGKAYFYKADFEEAIKHLHTSSTNTHLANSPLSQNYG